MKDEFAFGAFHAQMLDVVGEAIIATNLEGEIQYWNRAAELLYQWSANEVMGRDIQEITPSSATRQQAEQIRHSLSQGKTWIGEFEVQRKDGSRFLAFVSDSPIQNEKGELIGVIGVSHDITEQREIEKELLKIQWLLSPQARESQTERGPQSYGDLAELNTCRLILDSVGESILKDIVDDYLNLLDTSAAVYETNGDYAKGIFSSGWCRFMDQASRNLSNTPDNRVALESGKWHCHESCWKTASKPAIETGNPVDVECLGGLRLYAMPIFANGMVVGSLNFGYGDPPTDPYKLTELAELYQVSEQKLGILANEYDARPTFIIEMAKQRIQASARLIGEIVERQQIEAELRTAQKQLMDAQRLSEVGSWTWNVRSGAVTWTDQVYRIFGLDPQVFQPRIDSVMSHFHPDDQNQHQVLIQRANENHETLTFEARIVRSDGSWRNIILTSEPEFDEHGELALFTGSLQDITKRKKMGIAIRHERDRAQLYLKIAGVMFIALDDQGRITLANQKACQVLQAQEEDLLGQDWFETCIPERLRNDVRNVFQQLINSEVDPVEFYENEVLTSSGEERLVAWHNSTLYDGDGNIIGIIGSGEDVTERKRITERFEFQAKVLGQVSDAIIVTNNDEEFTVAFWNEGAEGVYGWKAEEVIGKPSLFLETQFKDQDRDRAIATITEGGHFSGEVTQAKKDGSRFPVDVRMVSLRDSQNNIAGWIAANRDITIRKQAETDLQESEEKFRRSEHNLRRAQDIANIGSWIWNTKTHTLEMSTEIYNIMGLEIEAGIPPLDFESKLIHPDDRAKLRDTIEMALVEKKPYALDYRILRADNGEERHLHVETEIQESDRSGELIFFGTVQDITERKRTEEELIRKMQEIERMNEMYVGREVRMIDLKDEINVLLEELGQPPKYSAPGQRDHLNNRKSL
jgi:PAS domain S-box-containing protein